MTVQDSYSLWYRGTTGSEKWHFLNDARAANHVFSQQEQIINYQKLVVKPLDRNILNIAKHKKTH